MKTHTSLTTVLFALCGIMSFFPLQAQKGEIKLTSSPTVQEVYSDSENQWEEQKITFDVSGPRGSGTYVVTISLDAHITSSNDDLKFDSQKVSADMGTTARLVDDDKESKKVEAKYFIKKDSLKENTEVFVVKVSAINPGKDTIIKTFPITLLNGAPAVNNNSAFRIAIGASFDFVDKVKPNSFYGQISFFEPDLINPQGKRTSLRLARLEMKAESSSQVAKLMESVNTLAIKFVTDSIDFYKNNPPSDPAKLVETKKQLDLAKAELEYKRNKILSREGFLKKIGLYAGLYQNKSVSKVIDSETYLRYNPLDFANDSTIRYQREQGFARNTIVTANLGLFAAPMYRIVRTQGKHQFSAFLNMELEAIHRRFSYTYDSLRIVTDTVNFKVGKTPTEVSNSSSLGDFYLGVGLPVFYKAPSEEFFFKMSTGLHFNTLEAENEFYYLFQFSVTETKAGINLGGEVRGVYGQSEKQYVGVFLSKVFDLSYFLKSGL